MIEVGAAGLAAVPGFALRLGLLALPLGEAIPGVEFGEELGVVVGGDRTLGLGLARTSPSDLDRSKAVRVLDRP